MKLKQARQKEDPKQREAVYQVRCLVRWALLEGAGLFCIVMSIVEKNLLFIGLFAICLFFFLTPFPSRYRFQSLFEESRYNRDPSSSH